VIKNKKKKYSLYTEFPNKEKVNEYLDDILSGSGNFHDMEGRLVENIKDYPEFQNVNLEQ
jgi:hypothetical protein